jgi:hypothetical protein
LCFLGSGLFCGILCITLGINTYEREGKEATLIRKKKLGLRSKEGLVAICYNMDPTASTSTHST